MQGIPWPGATPGGTTHPRPQPRRRQGAPAGRGAATPAARLPPPHSTTGVTSRRLARSSRRTGGAHRVHRAGQVVVVPLRHRLPPTTRQPPGGNRGTAGTLGEATADHLAGPNPPSPPRRQLQLQSGPVGELTPGVGALSRRCQLCGHSCLAATQLWTLQGQAGSCNEAVLRCHHAATQHYHVPIRGHQVSGLRSPALVSLL
mmetsp:Transcript_30498/g.67614  ORF Transcript_30498/g.67614 Transcript_30498/m.67614 type:complete len:202 (+) Transcript_30498:1242-1847(+)